MTKLHNKKPIVITLIILVIIGISVIPGLTNSIRHSGLDPESIQINSSSVLGDATSSALTSIAPDLTQTQFVINIPALFKQNVIAPNILYSLTAGKGVTVTAGQNPNISNTGVLSLQGQTGELALLAGDGISLGGLGGLNIINSGIKSLSAGEGITVDGNKITNTGINSLEAGEGIAIDGNKITNTRPAPDYSLSGWIDNGTTINLSTLTDSVLINALTFGSATIKNGSLIAPSIDLGANLGDATHRFNNLWVGKINSNSSSAFAGQSIFSYDPKDSTASESSVFINPISSVANGQLLGLALAGYERAFFDAEGDLLLGYNNLTSAPANPYPFNIFGHSGTSVAHFDTSGNLSLGNTLTSSTGILNVTNGLAITGNLAANSNVLYVDSTSGKVGIGTTTNLNQKLNVNGNTQGTNTYTQSLINRSAQNTSLTFGSSANTINFLTAGNSALYLNSTGNVGIGTTDPGSYKLNVNGTTNLQGATVIANTLDVIGNSTLNTLNANGNATISGSFIGNGSSNSIMGFLGIGTSAPTSQLDIASVTDTDALRLTSGGVKVLGMSIGTNAMAMDLTSSNPTNRLTNGSFDSDLLAWTGSQTYSLNDEFTDTAPTTIATSTPVTIQSGGVTNPTPTMGNEIIINPNMEDGFSNGIATGWASTAETNSDETTIVHSGTHSQKISGTNAKRFVQSISGKLTFGNWYYSEMWLNTSTNGSYFQIYDGAYLWGGVVDTIPNVWKQSIIGFRSTGTGNYFRTVINGNQTVYTDETTLKPLTLSSLFSTVPVTATATSTDNTVQADATLTSGTQAGLVMNLDSTTNPQNFIIAYHDGTNIRLEKSVAGTYTSLISTSATYVPGATIKVVKNGFNYSLYYNGVQKGTTQLITDAGIVNNINHGLFSTYATNSFTNFLVQSQVSNPTPTTGTEMWDAPASRFDSGTYAWTKYNNNIIENDANTLKITYVDNGQGAYTYFKDVSDLSSNLAIGQWYGFNLDTKVNTGSSVYGYISGPTVYIPTITNSEFQNIKLGFRATDSLTNYFVFSGLEAGESVWVDNPSLKPLTLSSLFSTVNANNSNVVASASATFSKGTQAGLVLNLDSTTNPQNFVIAYHDGTIMHLDKYINGSYTTLINISVGYVAGANITVRKSGTRYTVIYNGTQIGTDQTISDAGIINNTIHGLFSTYSGNTFTNFSIKTNLDGSLATDGVNTRVVVDTSSVMSISDGVVTLPTGTAWGNPKLSYNGVTRNVGKILTSKLNFTSTSGEKMFGYSPATTGNIEAGNGLYFYSGNIFFWENSTYANVAPFTSGTEYQVATILRNSGAYYYVKGGIYSNWTLIWVGSAGNISTLYPSIITRSASTAFTADDIHIPNSTWLPTPLAYDTFTATSSASTETTGPDGQTTPALSWTSGTKTGGSMSITPTTGNEVVGNNTFDTTDWWQKDACVAISGSTANYSNCTSTALYKWNTLTLGIWYQMLFDVVTLQGQIVAGAGDNYGPYITTTGAKTVTIRDRANTTLGIGVVGSTTASLDNVYIKPLTLSSLFSTVPTTKSDVIADTNVTLTAGTQAGLVLNLDSTTNPQNYILVYHDGSKVYYELVYGGVYVTPGANTTTYVPGATLRAITYHSGNDLKLRVYYNNVMIGAEYTISGTTYPNIVNNTIHGLFSTYASNTFDNFTLWPRGTGGEFAQLTPEDLTVTRDTTVKFAGSTSSAKIVAGGTDNDFTQMVNVGDTSTYTLTTYAYTNGTAVTASDLSLYYGSAPITTTYTPLGGDGWYRLQGTVTGIASNQPVGVRVKAGRTVYVDNITLSNGVATPTTMYVFNSGTGKANLNVQGLIDGTLGGIATFTKAGTIGDSDFSSVSNGLMGIDTLNHRLYFRENGTWSYIARTGGFQIPTEEAGDMSEGDLLLPYVESKLSDGALHGLYRKLSDITTGGQTTIKKDTDSVEIKFDKPFTKIPSINITLITTLTDNILLPEGHAYSIENLTAEGFTLTLDALAGRDYTYSWSAQLPE